MTGPGELHRRPGPGIWAAWTMAVVGGIAVVVAAVLVARAGSGCLAGSPCRLPPPPVATMLAFGGTGLAVLGVVTATLLTVRRFVSERR